MARAGETSRRFREPTSAACKTCRRDFVPGRCSTARWKTWTTRSERPACDEKMHRTSRPRRKLFAVDDAIFHDEGNFLERGDVVERVAGDGDDVREVARL